MNTIQIIGHCTGCGEDLDWYMDDDGVRRFECPCIPDEHMCIPFYRVVWGGDLVDQNGQVVGNLDA